MGVAQKALAGEEPKMTSFAFVGLQTMEWPLTIAASHGSPYTSLVDARKMGVEDTGRA
jgi:hypothetical protein